MVSKKDVIYFIVTPFLILMVLSFIYTLYEIYNHIILPYHNLEQYGLNYISDYLCSTGSNITVEFIHENKTFVLECWSKSYNSWTLRYRNETVACC